MSPRSNQQADSDDLRFADAFAPLMRSLPPIAGRMLGLLLVTDEPYLSSRDLMDQLGASSASISHMGRLLIEMGLVERTVSPETRRDLFSVRSDPWASQWRESVEIVERFLELLDRTLAERGKDHDGSLEKLTEMRDYYAFLSQEYPPLIERFEQWRAAKLASRAAAAGPAVATTSA